MDVQFSNSAAADLDVINEYYSEQGAPDVGLKFIKEIVSDVECLTNHPEIGRVVPEFNDSSIRELIRPPFRIVYLLGINSISVIRVWRSERLLKFD